MNGDLIFAIKFAATALFGAIVGSCELIGRYKDSPFRALGSAGAIWYIIVNATAASSAFGIICYMGWNFGTSGPATQLIQMAVAGFGAMAFFRSSLFVMKVGTTDIAVGPAILFQILLFATDRAVDRHRANQRSDVVAKIMQGVSFGLARAGLPVFCFELMQNVPDDEQAQFSRAVEELARNDAMTESVKTFNLGLMLMNVVGQDVLQTAVKQLGVQIQGARGLTMPVLRQLPPVVFEKAYPTLISICFVISEYGSKAEQAAREKEALEEGKKLLENCNIGNDTKVLLLALLLQLRVGDEVLANALRQLGKALHADPLPPAI